jgi:hypothetical protein
VRKHYIVVRQESLVALLDRVNELLVDGFELVGGVSTEVYPSTAYAATTFYLQAMVREEREDES